MLQKSDKKIGPTSDENRSPFLVVPSQKRWCPKKWDPNISTETKVEKHGFLDSDENVTFYPKTVTKILTKIGQILCQKSCPRFSVG